MEIVFLLAGLAFIGAGAAIVAFEIKARRNADPVQGRVIGFSLGRKSNPNMPSFHSVAECVGRDGRTYFVEGSVGSSVPLHVVGQPVTVLMNPREPEKADFDSALSYVVGGGLALLGLVAVAVFWFTFRLNLYSAAMALLVLGGMATKIRSAWRKKPLSLEAWRAYKKSALSARVFTEESKDQIVWADPLRVASAIAVHRKTNRFASPVLVGLSLILLFLSYHFYGKTQMFLESANPAVGRVVDLKERDSTDAGSSTWAAVVEYTDPAGKELQFVDPFSSSPPSYDVGDTVKVLYARENPSDARIDRGLVNYWLPVLFGVMGALFLLMGLHSARKYRSAATVSFLRS